MKAILMPVKGKAALKLDKIFVEAKPSKGEKITEKQRNDFMQFIINKWNRENEK